MTLEFYLDWTGRLVKSSMTGLKNWTVFQSTSGPVPVIFWSQRLDFKTLPMVQITKRPLYCITPALDRYLLHSDGTPHTQTMTSLNICGTVLYNTWHPHSHAFSSI